MSELRLPPEDMADIDRRFWDTVDMERRWHKQNALRLVSVYLSAKQVSLSTPQAAAGTKGCLAEK